jgi:hypothetical protein
VQLLYVIQSVPGGKVNILGGHSIGHSSQKLYTHMYPTPNVRMHSGEQHATSSHELQSALMLTVEFSKM